MNEELMARLQELERVLRNVEGIHISAKDLSRFEGLRHTAHAVVAAFKAEEQAIEASVRKCRTCGRLVSCLRSNYSGCATLTVDDGAPGAKGPTILIDGIQLAMENGVCAVCLDKETA